MPTKSHTSTDATRIPARPGDATLTVKKAASVLGVHPNTVRAWSEAGRLRYSRINERGARRYRLGDLHRFLSAAEAPASLGIGDGIGRASRREALPPTITETSAGLDLLADLAEVASPPARPDSSPPEARPPIPLPAGA